MVFDYFTLKSGTGFQIKAYLAKGVAAGARATGIWIVDGETLLLNGVLEIN